MTDELKHHAFSINRVRADFPLLTAGGMTYLDNAATTQKPNAVLDALQHYYIHDNANVHRSAHNISARATEAFEGARSAVQAFIGADSRESVIFTKGTTEAINLVANSYGNTFKPNDEILLTTMEHHSNIVPWQLLAERTGALIKTIPITATGELDMSAFEQLLSKRVRLVAVAHISNVLGTINPIAELVAKAHEQGAVVLVDGAQAMVHLPVDVQALDCDFYVFSSHKMLGPTGTGVLYGKESLLQAMPPWQAGGEMIKTVSFEHTTFNSLPYKFEAGTPDIAGVIGLGAAVRYLQSLDRSGAAAHEEQLIQLALSELNQLSSIRLVGTAANRAGAVSFVPKTGHPHDIGTLLNKQSIAVRTGHHCAMPLMAALNISGTARASFCLYNTKEEVNALVQGVDKACLLLGD